MLLSLLPLLEGEKGPKKPLVCFLMGTVRWHHITVSIRHGVQPYSRVQTNPHDWQRGSDPPNERKGLEGKGKEG